MSKASNKKTAIIIGAGPAGLTAAYELLKNTDIKPIIFEMTGDIGGISKTVNYKGNRIDIGGHRFFSKSDQVMKWWQNILPIEKSAENINGPSVQKTDQVMLVRKRLSRIFFLKKFFNYPISLNFNTLSNLGWVRVAKIGFSYFKARLLPIKPEKSLEDFFINRFGRELYLTFFKDYTQKVWGQPCERIKPEWGAQRVKGLSISKAIFHFLNNIFLKSSSVNQKKTETSLIEQFLYPKFGPGQLWQTVAKIIEQKGGELHLKHRVVGFKNQGNRITAVEVLDETTGQRVTYAADYFFSSMPVKDLIEFLGDSVPPAVIEVARGLVYRDFITVGLLLKQLKIKNGASDNLIADNWIYIQEREVKLGRLQIFNNWSPYLVKDQNTVWIGLEYFCNEGDELWSKGDSEFIDFAINELAQIGIIDKADVSDSTIIRMPK